MEALANLVVIDLQYMYMKSSSVHIKPTQCYRSITLLQEQINPQEKLRFLVTGGAEKGEGEQMKGGSRGTNFWLQDN